MLPDTSMALPWPSINRGLVFMSSRMSATICSRRDWLDSTRCMVPHFCLSWALARSFRPLVLASNQASIFFYEVMAWSMSRAS
jgi:hypothetical protein